jgi:hypothetical protein
MDRKYIDDHHVVARYLADQLPDLEREAFEAYCLEHADIVQELEAAARFKVGLLQLQDARKLEQLMRPAPWFRQRRNLAVAAAIAIVAVGLSLFYLRSPVMQPMLAAASSKLADRYGDPLPIAATYMILRARGSSYDAEIELPDRPQSIELCVLPEVEAQPPRYRIMLASIADDESLHEIGTLTGLAPAADGFVRVFLNSSRLAAGRYQLVLAGDAGTSAADGASPFLIKFTAHLPER